MPPAMSQARVRMPLGDGRRAAYGPDGGGELKSEQAGGVVDEALAFEDVDDAAGQPDAPGDGGGGDGVGGGDDGAEHQAEAPVEAGEDVVAQPGRRRQR